jgi:hypothetical protein
MKFDLHSRLVAVFGFRIQDFGLGFPRRRRSRAFAPERLRRERVMDTSGAGKKRC